MKVCKIIISISIYIFAIGTVYATDLSVTREMSNELNLDEIVDELNSFTKDVDLESISSSLIEGNGVEYEKIGKSLIHALKSGVTSSVKNMLFILIFLILIAIIKSLELEQDSSITKAANLVAVLVIISVLLGTYSDVLSLMKKAVDLEIGIIQVVSPFMMGILILTGAITTAGLIEPVILFLVSAMGFCVNYIIMPLITISIIFNIITNISDAVNLSKFSSFSNKTALWINGIFLAIFLAVAGLQTAVSTSVDSVTIKATQAAVSGTIPVVRKVCIG